MNGSVIFFIEVTRFKNYFLYTVYGGSGKSTLINVIRNLLGEYATSSASLEALVSNKFAKAGIHQKTANFDSDARAYYLEDGVILKMLRVV